MSSSTKPSPEITRAAERYLEQYGDPLVMKHLFEGGRSCAGRRLYRAGALTFKSQQALANMHPMIVRINDVGHAEANRLSELPVSPARSGEQVLPHSLGRTVISAATFHDRT